MSHQPLCPCQTQVTTDHQLSVCSHTCSMHVSMVSCPARVAHNGRYSSMAPAMHYYTTQKLTYRLPPLANTRMLYRLLWCHRWADSQSACFCPPSYCPLHYVCDNANKQLHTFLQQCHHRFLPAIIHPRIPPTLDRRCIATDRLSSVTDPSCRMIM
jgi:hypothetical protein